MATEVEIIEQEAADWLIRRDRGFTPEQEAEFLRWLKSDARHFSIYRAVSRSWQRFDRVRGSAVAAELGEEIAALARPKRPSPLWILSALGAAAALAVGYIAGWRPAGASASFEATAATDVGVFRKLNLPDGSVILLNTDTALNVWFSPAERDVKLIHGEALFTVAKNRSRPFIVTAAGVEIRAVGTAFDVHADSGKIKIIVTEGRVHVHDAAKGTTLLESPRSTVPTAASPEGGPPNGEPILAAGQGVVIPAAVGSQVAPVSVDAAALSSAEIDRALAWQRHKLIFSSASLADIVAEFNRYNREKLIIADPDLARHCFGGTFEANDLATFVQLLHSNFGIIADKRDGYVILRASK